MSKRDEHQQEPIGPAPEAVDLDPASRGSGHEGLHETKPRTKGSTMNQRDLRAEVGSPVDENVEPWVMLGYLRGRLMGGNPITLDEWNRAITLLKDDGAK